MDSKGGAPREIAVPVSVFGSLRTELAKEAGTLPTVHALHHAGYHAGTDAAPTVIGSAGNGAALLSQNVFWSRLADFFSERGWGNLRHDPVHKAVGFLSSADWAEAGADVDAEASCFFSTGFLSGLLSALAGGPVAVLEVGCRTRGEDRCTFAFGSETAIHDLYGRLLAGDDIAEALDAL
jgi:hypothetical protein